MVLLTKEEDNKPIEVDESIIKAPSAHPTRLQRLLVCVERLLGESWLFWEP